MNIVSVIPIFGRQNITLKTLEIMKKQTHPLHEVVVVGSGDVDKQTAQKAGVVYVHHENKPLSTKWQAGVYRAKDFNPDAILINGSDSWLSANWCEIAKKYIEEGFHLVGKTQWYSCRVNPKQPLMILKASYLNRKDPVGAGRLFSRELLERVNWKIYPDGANGGLDGRSFRLVLPAITSKGVHRFNDRDEAVIMGVKSTTWTTKTNFAFVQRNYGREQVKNPKEWVEKVFPGSLEIFKEVVPGVKI